MKFRLLLLGVGILTVISVFLINPEYLISRPSFNGDAPGCAGGGCHSLQDGVTTVTNTNGMQIEVTLVGVSSGDAVAGELVNEGGIVVDVNNGTNSNPFILTAPADGNYIVNAGFKNPSRDWDSVRVSVGATAIDPPVSDQVAGNFELFPNHPNPFNSQTMIQFSLPVREAVELNIYNVRGQLVRRLLQSEFQAGIHTVRWDGTGENGAVLASGIYMFELKTPTHQQTRRLILSK